MPPFIPASGFTRTFGLGLLCAGSAWALSLLFPLNLPVRLVLVLISGMGFFWQAGQSMQHQAASQIQEHYLGLLAFLSSRLAVGETLDKACLNYVQEQARVHGPRMDPAYGAGLHRMAQQISLRGNLTAALQALLVEFPDPQVHPVLLALPKLSEMGGRLDRFVRDCHHSLLTFRSLEQEVRAEQGQKWAEAWILNLMPFALAMGSVLMVAPADRMSLISDPRSQLVYALVFLSACGSLILTSRFSRNPRLTPAGQKLGQSATKSRGSGWPSGQWLALAYQKPPLRGFTRPVIVALAQFPGSEKSYFQMKLLLIGLAGLLALIWILAGIVPLLVLLAAPLASSLLQDLNLLQKKRRVVNQYRLIYPFFLTWLVNGLLSGFSVTRVLREAGSLWRSDDPGHVLSQDLDLFHRQAEGGRPTYWITEQLALHSPVPEIQSFWLSLARYEREGNPELLNLLVLMAENSRQLLRIGKRQELEEKSLYLLIPMLLDLLAVLVLAAWPSLSLLIL